MAWDIITKQTGRDRPAPNVRDYAAVQAAFTWEVVRAELAMLGGLNIAHWALDRHVVESRGDHKHRVALLNEVADQRVLRRQIENVVLHGPAPNPHLLLVPFLARVVLVQADEIAVIALVQRLVAVLLKRILAEFGSSGCSAREC